MRRTGTQTVRPRHHLLNLRTFTPFPSHFVNTCFFGTRRPPKKGLSFSHRLRTPLPYLIFSFMVVLPPPVGLPGEMTPPKKGFSFPTSCLFLFSSSLSSNIGFLKIYLNIWLLGGLPLPPKRKPVSNKHSGTGFSPPECLPP